MNEFYISDLANKSSLLNVSVLILIVPVLLISLFIYFWLGLPSSRVEIHESSLKFKGVFYGRTIDIKDIVIDEIKLLGADKNHKISGFRTNGISILGLNWGWFRLKGTNRKTLLFVTDSKKNVLIPTKLDFDVIISVKEPENLVAVIKQKERKNEIH